MFDLTKLPKRVAKKIEGLPWSCDEVGMSGSSILLFDEMVLKIEKISRSSANERKLLGWLTGKLPIPEIIVSETKDDYSFILMTRLQGEMASSDNSLQQMDKTIKALANALKMLWRVDICNCPCTNGVVEKLIQAQFNIENNLVDTDDFDPETITSEGFKNVSDLFSYLEQNRPIEDLVFSHGDFCLPNVFVSGADVVGFLDWGNGGIADRWQDIALCVHSLRTNLLSYAGHSEEEYQKYRALFFSKLDIAPNEEKMRYYRLLDELF